MENFNKSTQNIVKIKLSSSGCYFVLIFIHLPPIINSQKGVPEYYGLRLYPLNLIRVMPAKGFYDRRAPFCYNFSTNE